MYKQQSLQLLLLTKSFIVSETLVFLRVGHLWRGLHFMPYWSNLDPTVFGMPRP